MKDSGSQRTKNLVWLDQPTRYTVSIRIRLRTTAHCCIVFILLGTFHIILIMPKLRLGFTFLCTCTAPPILFSSCGCICEYSIRWSQCIDIKDITSPFMDWLSVPKEFCAMHLRETLKAFPNILAELRMMLRRHKMFFVFHLLSICDTSYFTTMTLGIILFIEKSW